MGKKRIESLPAKAPVGVKIEKSRPDESLEAYVRLLNEAIRNQSRAQQDCDAYRTNAMSERQKGMQLQSVVFELKDRDKRGVGPVLSKYGVPSRMDPMNTYVLEDVEAELAECKVRQLEFQKTSDHYAREVTRLRGKVNEYEILIRDFDKNRDIEYRFIDD